MLRTIPIHRSLHRANTLMGGDREIVMMAALISISSIAIGQHMLSAIGGICFWFIVLIPARRLAKNDHQMKTVFFASLAFWQKYYPPHTHILASPRCNYKAEITNSCMKYKG